MVRLHENARKTTSRNTALVPHPQGSFLVGQITASPSEACQKNACPSNLFHLSISTGEFIISCRGAAHDATRRPPLPRREEKQQKLKTNSNITRRTMAETLQPMATISFISSNVSRVYKQFRRLRLFRLRKLIFCKGGTTLSPFFPGSNFIRDAITRARARALLSSLTQPLKSSRVSSAFFLSFFRSFVLSFFPFPFFERASDSAPGG